MLLESKFRSHSGLYTTQPSKHERLLFHFKHDRPPYYKVAFFVLIRFPISLPANHPPVQAA